MRVQLEARKNKSKAALTAMGLFAIGSFRQQRSDRKKANIWRCLSAGCLSNTIMVQEPDWHHDVKFFIVSIARPYVHGRSLDVGLGLVPVSGFCSRRDNGIVIIPTAYQRRE